MRSSAKLEVQLLVDALVKGGVTDVVLSPGSRNAPLSIAFDEHPEIRTFVIADERCAAFYALGMAQQLQRPVAVACTSGSAPLNYFPAVAEAYYQGVPMVIITADRPLEWVDQGDGQTIVQDKVYGTHVLAHAQLGVIHSDSQRWLFERQCAEVIQQANGRKQGPVHLNVPFGEPLYETTEDPQQLKQWIRRAEGRIVLSSDEKDLLREKWTSAKRKMVICGQMKHQPELQRVLEDLAADGSVAVLVEHTSNLQSAAFVQCIDRSLNQMDENAMADYQPDLLVVIGGAVISKRIKAFLRTSAGIGTIRIANDFPFMDTFRSLLFTTSADKADTVGFLKSCGGNVSDFGKQWKALGTRSAEKHDDYLAGCTFSDLRAMGSILESLPGNVQLHISNSSIIRYALLFDPQPSVRYWCNRGTSGIDGSSSTACGAALADPDRLHVLITGDMSFFYDSNAFWSAHKPSNLRVIVINNGGGDIFNIIPGPSSVPQRGTYFVAEQQYSAEHICKAYGLEYASVNSQQTLAAALPEFFVPSEDGKIKLLEIQTAGLGNSEILKDYWQKSR
jgi:2-succinyl-5-enolpyruvyl-6-hydroxy-3-cyclohexene-1-carboxylate synthase